MSTSAAGGASCSLEELICLHQWECEQQLRCRHLHGSPLELGEMAAVPLLEGDAHLENRSEILLNFVIPVLLKNLNWPSYRAADHKAASSFTWNKELLQPLRDMSCMGTHPLWGYTESCKKHHWQLGEVEGKQKLLRVK